jgi:hypothetical protein
MQQYEKLKASYAARAVLGGGAEGCRAVPRRVQELEKQLEEVRAHYQKKVRGLQVQLSALTAAARSDSASGAPSGAHPVLRLVKLQCHRTTSARWL